MSVYIKTKEESLNTLTHYGVKGMKWRKHKRSMTDLYDAMTNPTSSQQALATIYDEAYKEKQEQDRINELKKNNKGPVARKVKVSGKGKKLYRRKATHNVWNNARNYREITEAKRFLKNYLGITRAYSKSKKAKNAAQLGMRYVRAMKRGLHDYTGE